MFNHEHLHTRSSKRVNSPIFYNKNFEENACEMLAEEICSRCGIYYKRTYKRITEPLRDISGICSSYLSDYDFAMDYFKVEPHKRKQWLLDLADKETDESVRRKIFNSIKEIENG